MYITGKYNKYQQKFINNKPATLYLQNWNEINMIKYKL